MNKLDQIIATALLVSIALFAPQAGAVTQTVDCDRGQTIQSALDKKQRSSEQLVINVSGTCNEIAKIQRDSVTINGNNSATISGTLELQGADRIYIEDIIVTGPGIGIVAEGSNSVIISNVTVTENQGWSAIVAKEGSSLKILNSDISSNNGHGIAAQENSSIVIYDTPITQNRGWTAIFVVDSSAVKIEGSSVSNNSESGAFVGLGSSLNLDNTIFSNNGEIGIGLASNSSGLIGGGSSIQGHSVSGILVKEHSLLDVRDTDVSNNPGIGIGISEDGGVILRSGVSISGNGDSGIACADTESSYQNPDSVIIADPINCTDFNQASPTP